MQNYNSSQAIEKIVGMNDAHDRLGSGKTSYIYRAYSETVTHTNYPGVWKFFF